METPAYTPPVAQPIKPDDRMITKYEIRGDGPYPFTETGWCFHRADLSDLDERYRAAVERTLAEQTGA